MHRTTNAASSARSAAGSGSESTSHDIASMGSSRRASVSKGRPEKERDDLIARAMREALAQASHGDALHGDAQGRKRSRKPRDDTAHYSETGHS